MSLHRLPHCSALAHTAPSGTTAEYPGTRMQSISIVTIFPFALAVAFLLGFGARMVGLPPLVGFLVAGKQPGKFSLEIEFVRAWAPEPGDDP